MRRSKRKRKKKRIRAGGSLIFYENGKRFAICSVCKVDVGRISDESVARVCGDCMIFDPFGYQRFKAKRSVLTFANARQMVDSEAWFERVQKKRDEIKKLMKDEKIEKKIEKRKISTYIKKYWKKKIKKTAKLKLKTKFKKKILKTLETNSFIGREKSMNWLITHSNGEFVQAFKKLTGKRMAIKWALKNGYSDIYVKQEK